MRFALLAHLITQGYGARCQDLTPLTLIWTNSQISQGPKIEDTTP
jgi:hypothetical protein